MPTLDVFDNSLVTTGNPFEGGCCWTSFAETPTLPTDAATKMSTLTAFESVGDLSENGFTEGKSVTNNEFEGWRGSTVLTQISKEKQTYKVAFIEVNRPTAAKLRYGSANVEVNDEGSVSHIKHAIGVNETVPLVFDELDSAGYLRRTVVKAAKVESFDEVPHQKGSLMTYGMTFTALDTGNGLPVETFRAKPASA